MPSLLLLLWAKNTTEDAFRQLIIVDCKKKEFVLKIIFLFQNEEKFMLAKKCIKYIILFTIDTVT